MPTPGLHAIRDARQSYMPHGEFLAIAMWISSACLCMRKHMTGTGNRKAELRSTHWWSASRYSHRPRTIHLGRSCWHAGPLWLSNPPAYTWPRWNGWPSTSTAHRRTKVDDVGEQEARKASICTVSHVNLCISFPVASFTFLHHGSDGIRSTYGSAQIPTSVCIVIPANFNVCVQSCLGVIGSILTSSAYSRKFSSGWYRYTLNSFKC